MFFYTSFLAFQSFDLDFEYTFIGDTCVSRDLEINGKSVKVEDARNAFLSASTFFYAKVQNADEFLSA